MSEKHTPGPEPLEALKKITEWLQVADSHEEPMSVKSVRRCLKVARAAIAKARGE